MDKTQKPKVLYLYCIPTYITFIQFNPEFTAVLEASERQIWTMEQTSKESYIFPDRANLLNLHALCQQGTTLPV